MMNLINCAIVSLIAATPFKTLVGQDTLVMKLAYDYGITKETIAEDRYLLSLYDEIRTGSKSFESLESGVAEKIESIASFGSILYTLLPGCSWYCGANYTTTCSGYLSNSNGNSYNCDKISNFMLDDAWIEGKSDYGIGETIEFTFPSNHPRLTDIIIANGYVKNETLYYDNSRVKTLKMELDNKLYAIIEISDLFAMQSLSLKAPILGGEEPATIRFTIMEIYPGRKYKDTAISQLYFDGLDVH